MFRFYRYTQQLKRVYLGRALIFLVSFQTKIKFLSVVSFQCCRVKFGCIFTVFLLLPAKVSRSRFVALLAGILLLQPPQRELV